MEPCRITKCSPRCQASCSRNINNVLDSTNSATNLYKSQHAMEYGTNIQNDTGYSNVKAPDLINELRHYKPQCLLCKLFLPQIRNLVRDISPIDIKEIPGICNHCKNLNSTRQCKRCSFIFNRYMQEKESFVDRCDKQCHEILVRIKTLLSDFEKHEKIINLKSTSLDEMLKNLQHMKIKGTQEPDGSIPGRKYDFGSSSITRNVPADKFKTSCVCEDLIKKLQEKMAFIDSKNNGKPFIPDVLSRSHLERTKNIAIDSSKKVITKPECKKNIAKDTIEQPKKEKESKIKNQSHKIKGNEFVKVSKKIKVHNKSLDLLEKMIFKQHKNRKRVTQYNLKKFKLPDIGELPPLPVKKIKEPVSHDSGSIVECQYSDKTNCTEMIKGNLIVPDKYSQSHFKHKTSQPLLFNVNHNFVDENLSNLNSTTTQSPVHLKTKLSSTDKKNKQSLGKYRLSNKKYVENGWTILPTLTFVRRLNIYKMVHSESKFDWFENHKIHKQMFYDTGELLAEVYDGGLFKWYYRDGNVALDFIDTIDADTNSTKKYYVYDYVTKNKEGYQNTVPILASFDDKGHGTVSDRFGYTRIKYNQAEGMLFDCHIGPPCHWKWNMLNEPPQIQVEQVLQFLEPLDSNIENLAIETKNEDIPNADETVSLPRSQIKIFAEYEDKRNEVELNNLIREKSTKISMEYTPFEIRSKIFKLNDHLSLRILGQSKIYVLFRYGKFYFKLNVGMKLISNEIVDIKTVANEQI